MLLDSGANHERVAQMNPHWTVNDWCRYWELDARKLERKHQIKWERIKDCGDDCRCMAL